jgi:hypothetical protein
MLEAKEQRKVHRLKINEACTAWQEETITA